MSVGSSNPLANFMLLDTKIGDRVLNLAALTAIILGNPSQEAAFAAAIQAILDADPSPSVVTTLQVNTNIQLGTGTRTATATGGAATLNKPSGTITTEALTTAAGAAYTLTLSDTSIAAADIVIASVDNGTNTGGIPVLSTVHPAANGAVIKVYNLHATDAFNGTLKISFAVLKNALA